MLYQSLESDVASLSIMLVYSCVIILLHKASGGMGGIDRNVVRILPSARQSPAQSKAEAPNNMTKNYNNSIRQSELSNKKRSTRHGLALSTDGASDWVKPEARQERRPDRESVLHHAYFG